MKVVVLGGCGVVGASAARDIIKSLEVTSVIVADKVIDMTTNVHESVRNSPKVTTQTIDVTNHEDLVKLLKGNDVVINMVGPYYRFGIGTMKAAIEAGTNYVDVCDDYEVALESFALDEPAKKAGVAICFGFGAGPGLNNVIAKFAADKMDEVDEIHFQWGGSIGDPCGPGVWLHAINIAEGDVPQFLDGKLVYVPAGSGGEEVEFLGLPGKYEVYYYGHTEPVTVPRFIKGVKTVTLKGVNLPLFLNDLFRTLLNLGLASAEPIEFQDTKIEPRDFLMAVLQKSEWFNKQIQEFQYSPANIIVKGKEGNAEVTYKYALTGHMAPASGMTASFMAQMIANGEISQKGVLFPEQIDPKLILTRFKAKGLRLIETKTLTQEAKI